MLSAAQPLALPCLCALRLSLYLSPHSGVSRTRTHGQRQYPFCSGTRRTRTTGGEGGCSHMRGRGGASRSALLSLPLQARSPELVSTGIERGVLVVVQWLIMTRPDGKRIASTLAPERVSTGSLCSSPVANHDSASELPRSSA